MTTSRTGGKTTLYGVGAALALIFGAWALLSSSHTSLWDMQVSKEEVQRAYEYTPTKDSTLIRFTPGIESWYVNAALGFSFRLPEGFTAPDGELRSGGYGVLVSDAKGHEMAVRAIPDAAAPPSITQSYIEGTATFATPLATVLERALPDDTKVLTFSAGEGEDARAHAWFTHQGYRYQIEALSGSEELINLTLQSWRFGTPIPPPPPQGTRGI